MKSCDLRETLSRIAYIIASGMLIFLSACGTSPSFVTAIETTTPMATTRLSTHLVPTLTITPWPDMTTIVTPTVFPSLVVQSPTLDEFDRDGLILYTVSPGIADTYHIYAINPDGTGLECITCDFSISPSQFVSPRFWSSAWAPSGMKYAYVAQTDLVDGIIIRQKDVLDTVLISGSNAWFNHLVWSTDGDNIAFTKNNDNEAKTDLCYVQVDLESPNKQCINQEIKVRYPDWSADGERIIFSASGYEYKFHLYVLNLKDQSIIQLSNVVGFELHPDWSPDGSKLAYVLGNKTGDNYQSDLYMANADGTDPVIVLNTGGIDDFSWSPDGSRIVFTQLSPIKNEPCDFGCLPFMVLKILDLQTGEITSLTDGKQWIGDPSWRP